MTDIEEEYHDTPFEIEEVEFDHESEHEDVWFGVLKYLRDNASDIIEGCSFVEMSDMIKMFGMCRQHVHSSLRCACYDDLLPTTKTKTMDDVTLIVPGNKRLRQFFELYDTSDIFREDIRNLYKYFKSMCDEMLTHKMTITYDHFVNFVGRNFNTRSLVKCNV